MFPGHHPFPVSFIIMIVTEEMQQAVETEPHQFATERSMQFAGVSGSGIGGNVDFTQETIFIVIVIEIEGDNIGRPRPAEEFSVKGGYTAVAGEDNIHRSIRRFLLIFDDGSQFPESFSRDSSIGIGDNINLHYFSPSFLGYSTR